MMRVRRRVMAGRALWVAFALAARTGAALPDHTGFDAGPIATRDRSVGGFTRLRVAGPLFERAEHANGAALHAVRPFYSAAEPPNGDVHGEVLWPLAGFDRIGDTANWRVLTAFGMDADVNDPQSQERLWVLPFYLGGQTADGESYRALFPLGGRVADVIGRDEIRFVLWPLYTYSRVNDVETRDVLWPVVSWTRGEGHRRTRVWPFWGEAERAGDYHKRFVMWPFWTQVRYEDPPGGGWMLWPLYGHTALEGQATHMFLPPLFRYSFAHDMTLIHSPWPLVQYASGRDLEKLYLWPLWGRKRIEHLESGFFAWPVARWETLDPPGEGIRRRWWLNPVYYRERDTRAGRDHHRVRVWPLFDHVRRGEQSRTHALDLWPLMDSEPIERSWAPLWTLYSRHATAEAAESEYLWGLLRHGRTADGERFFRLFPLVDWDAGSHNAPSFAWSLLKGGLAYRREGTNRSLRVLYVLRFGAAHAETTESEPTAEQP